MPISASVVLAVVVIAGIVGLAAAIVASRGQQQDEDMSPDVNKCSNTSSGSCQDSGPA